MRYFDTHCHLDFPDYKKDREEVIKRAKESGVEYMVNVGVNVESSKKCIDIAKKYDFIFAACGIHPSEVDKYSIDNLKGIEKIGKNEPVVAIGEIGLDFYYGKDNKEKQIEIFTSQLKIASDLSLPVIIHQRESKDEIIEVLEKMKGNLSEKIVFHCFGSDEKLAQYCEENGFFISFTGIITFKNASGVRKVAKNFPLERIMAETDSPYLSPSPLRGKRNEPARVRYIVEEIANQKGRDIKEISEKIFSNSINFFPIRH